MEKFIFGSTEADQYFKWTQFIWILSLVDVTPDDLLRLPDKLLVVIITLLFMVQEKEITIDEADILLLAEYDTVKQVYCVEHIKEPKFLDGRTIRIIHKYQKFVMLIEDCLFACGLNDFIVSTSESYSRFI